jgi:hypothetical protein
MLKLKLVKFIVKLSKVFKVSKLIKGQNIKSNEEDYRKSNN